MESLRSLTMHRFTLAVMFALTLFSCNGGGCSGCAGCGITPIPGGYPLDQRIDNAAQMRVTQSGLAFVENNIDPIVANFLPDGLDFPIPRTTGSASGADYDICRSDDCFAHAEIESLELSPTAPNSISFHLRARLESTDSTGAHRPLPLRLETLFGAITTNCQVDIQTTNGSRSYIGLAGNIALNTETRAARNGYTRIEVSSLALAMGEGIEDDDVELGSCSGIAGAIINALSGLLKDLLLDQLQGQIDGLLSNALGDSLCTQQGEFGCPTGTNADGSPDDPAAICRFSDGECVPILLGTDGRGDLGGTAIGGFSPGTHAYAQFLLAAGGDGEAVNEGMSLYFYGGFMGTDRTFTNTPAHNSCVPVTEPPPLPTIARAEAFRQNMIPDTTVPADVGFGIAEPYLDYAGWGMFDSGALCIGAGTRLSQQLSTGLVSALITSLPDLTYPLDNAPLSIAVRPQIAPDFSIGSGGDSDALLQIDLRQVQIDFYVWSTERYIRFMTFQTDLNIGINLSVADNQIVPAIANVSASNSTVTNSELLDQDGNALAGVIETVISMFAGMLSSGISPFDLPSIMGLALNVPAEGIRPVREGGTSFLGIFANLALAASPIVAEVDTTLEVSDLALDRDAMRAESWGDGANRVWLSFDVAGYSPAVYEYSYRIDGGPWSSWHRESRFAIEDDALLLQARHQIEGRARVVGEPSSVDTTPAAAELIVDILPPTVSAQRTANRIEVVAHDIVSGLEGLEYRYQIDGEWTEWTRDATATVALDVDSVAVEVRDEAGNVGGAQAALIRGLPNPEAAGGCGCRVAGSPSSPLAPFGFLGLGLAALALVLRRARRTGRAKGAATKAAAALAALIGLSMLSGCECSSPPCGGTCVAAVPPAVTAGSLCCEATNMCANYDVDALCDPGYTCPVENVVADASCGVTCTACTVKPPLASGELATYLDIAVDDSSNVYLSGYSAGPGPGNGAYGDLVFGQWNGTSVDWEIVDGAPSSPIVADPNAWRGGVSAPGDDVGRWTSIVEDNGSFLISYYDVTNRALKLAAGGPGAWATHTIDDEGDSGRYSSMIITSSGVPVVAYLRMAESTMTPGVVMGSVMVATANMANPSSASDWTITEVASAQMPCRGELCSSGTCIESGLCVTPTSDCASACGSGEACFMGNCQATFPSGWVEDMPPAYGLYVSLAETPTGLGVVFYDRTAGNIYGSSFDGAAWSAPFLIDGYAVGDEYIGDCGQGADLAVDDSGVWHVVYVDGAEETLRYATVNAAGAVNSTEVIDDGSTSDGSTRFTDGRHIVGDDASILVDGSGVHVVYQDATSGHAVAANGSAGTWTIERIDTEGSTGYWIGQASSGSSRQVARLFRVRMGRNLNSGVRVSSF
ncbi:MAG: MYXO-CTERM sorting domain-containing protein [Sandaracinaceae bacterium]